MRSALIGGARKRATGRDQSWKLPWKGRKEEKKTEKLFFANPLIKIKDLFLVTSTVFFPLGVFFWRGGTVCSSH